MIIRGLKWKGDFFRDMLGKWKGLERKLFGVFYWSKIESLEVMNLDFNFSFLWDMKVMIWFIGIWSFFFSESERN